MKIALDARELEGSPTGAGRVLSELLKRLKPDFLARHRIYLYFKREIPSLPEFPEGSFEKIVLKAPALLRKDIFWEQILLPKRLRTDGIDLFWGANGAGPLFCPKKTQVWVTIYDLTYFMDASWYGLKERVVRQLRSRIAAMSADRMITSSEASKADIQRWLHKKADQIKVLYLGSDAVAGSNNVSGPSTKQNLLFVGSLLNRRPLEHVITAVSQLKKEFPKIRLRIIGENRTHPRRDLHAQVQDLGLQETVIIDGYVSDAELSHAYQEATIFCFPSHYEGFGLPLVEAQQRGIPVITLRNSSLAEISADSVCYAESPDAQSWAQAIRSLLLNPDKLRILHEKGPQNANRFTWDGFAAQWQSLVQSVTIKK